MRCQPEDGLNGFLVALFKHKEGVSRPPYVSPAAAAREQEETATQNKKRRAPEAASGESKKPKKEKAVAKPFRVRKMKR